MNEWQGQQGWRPYPPLLEAHRRFSLVGVALCVMMAVWLGMNIICTGALGVLMPQGVPMWMLVLASSGPLYALAMPLALTVLRRVPALRTREFSLGAKRFRGLLLVCFPVMIVGNIIGAGLADMLSGGSAANRVSDMILASDPWVNALFVVLLAPLFEEWMFRRQLIDRTRRYGERTSIILSAFAFALFHMNLYQFFYAFGLGLVFGYAYMRTSRLRYSVALHMIVNAFGSLLAPAVLALAGDSSVAAADGGMSDERLMALMGQNAGVMLIGLYGLLMLGLAVAGAVVLLANLRRLEFYDPPEQLPRWYGARAAMLNPGMIVYTVMTVALSLWMM